MQISVQQHIQKYRAELQEWFSEWQNVVFVVVLFLAVLMRLLHYTTEVNMGLDGFRHTMEMWLASEYSRPLLFSVDLQGLDFRMPPWYYYMILPFMKLTGYHPLAFNTVELLLFFVSLPLFYGVVSRISDKTTSVVTTAMYGLSYIMYSYSMGSWNPDAIPAFVVMIIWLLFRSEERVRAGETPYGTWVLLAIVYSIAPTFHFSIMPMYIVIVGYALYRWRLFLKKLLLIAIAIVVPILSYIPTLTWDVKNEYKNLKAMFAFFFSPFLPKEEASQGFGEKIQWILENTYNYVQFTFIQYVVGERYGEGVHNVVHALLAVGIVAGIVWLVVKIRTEKEYRAERVLVGSFLLAAILGMLAIHLSFRTRYLITIIPLFYIFFGLSVGVMLRNRYARVVGVLIVGSFLLVNASLYRISRSGDNVPTEYGYTPQRSISEYMAVADWMYENRDPEQGAFRVDPVDPNKEFRIFNDNDIYNFLLRWEHGNLYPKDVPAQFAVVYITQPEKETQLEATQKHFDVPCEYVEGNLCVVPLWKKN